MEQENDIFNHLKAKKGNTPDAAYFENLAKGILEQESMVEKKITPFYKKPATWLIATAASLAFILFLNTDAPVKDTPLLAMSAISSEDAMTYIDANIDEFDMYLIAEYVSDEVIEESKIEISAESPSVDSQPSDISRIKELEEVDLDDILDYLEYEEIDIEELEDDLYI